MVFILLPAPLLHPLFSLLPLFLFLPYASHACKSFLFTAESSHLNLLFTFILFIYSYSYFYFLLFFITVLAELRSIGEAVGGHKGHLRG